VFSSRADGDRIARVASNGPNEAKLLSRFRIVSIAAILLAILVYVAGEIFELPFLRTTFHVEPTVLGVLVGALIVLLGIETINRIPGIGRGGE
jgi:hypothetical protein